MKHNVFSFGNRFSWQLNGTAMGTNVACMYATIYYSFHEEMVLLQIPSITFYRRLIDDAFILFKGREADYDNIVTAMNSFGPLAKRLEWVVDRPKNSANFLDLTVILDGSELQTKTFQKPDNMYLYRTPTLCQPDCYLKSFVYGSLYRYYWQNTLKSDYAAMAVLLFCRLLDRGHVHKELLKIFESTLIKVTASKLPNPKPATTSKKQHGTKKNDILILHMPYHPNNPNKKEMRSLTALF